MYQALPYKTWHTTSFPNTAPLMNNLLITSSSSSNRKVTKREDNVSIKRLVDESAVMIFGKLGCCMNHVVKSLLLGLGVNPVVHEFDEMHDGQYVIDELKDVGPIGMNVGGAKCMMSFPTVFIGGRWYGDLDRVIATHITGEMTPILRDAGALWL